MQRFLHQIVCCVSLLVAAGCGSFDQASVPDYQTVIEDSQHDTELAKKEHAKALKILGRHYAGRHADLKRVERLLHDALVADVTYGPAHNTLGLVYFEQRKLYLAAWEFEYAAKVMPEHTEPIYNQALVYEQADKIDRAIALYEEALALDTKNATILGALVRARLRHGEPLDALRPELEQLVFLDSRPEWVAWAKNLLGTHPEEIRLVDSGALLLEAEELPQGEPANASEELPLPQTEAEVESDARSLPPVPFDLEALETLVPASGAPELVVPEP